MPSLQTPSNLYIIDPICDPNLGDTMINQTISSTKTPSISYKSFLGIGAESSSDM